MLGTTPETHLVHARDSAAHAWRWQVVIVRAPDGVELRLTHRSAVLSGTMEADWQLEVDLSESGG